MSPSPGRRLATLETITDIRDIPDADAIVCARIRGWDVVVKRDEFRPGDLCIYIEVDTLVDTTDPRFAFLAPRGIRTDAEGTSGHVLKTARLRGQYSQGLALHTTASAGPPGRHEHPGHMWGGGATRDKGGEERTTCRDDR